MTAVMVPAMAALDISAFLEVVQNTIQGSADKQDLPGLDESTSSRFQQPNLNAWIDAQTKGARLIHLVQKGSVSRGRTQNAVEVNSKISRGAPVTALRVSLVSFALR